ncbi:hypothetical protein ACFQ0D_31980 [Micromonospora zhanjiangensis]
MNRTSRRLIILLAAACSAVALTVATVAGAAAAAAPRAAVTGTTATAPKPGPKAPLSVRISGEQMGEPLVIRAETDETLYDAVFDQVSWMGGAGQARALSAEDLGVKYTVLVFSGDVATQTYDLYPFAKGGPRACRPAKQPGRTGTAAWFYGRLNMPETLRAAGVPLAERPGTVTGGIGGGVAVERAETLDPGKDVDRVLGDLQRVLLLNAGVVIAITAGLAAIALLIRRRSG